MFAPPLWVRGRSVGSWGGGAELLQQQHFLLVEASPTHKPESVSIQEQEGAGNLGGFEPSFVPPQRIATAWG